MEVTQCKRISAQSKTNQEMQRNAGMDRDLVALERITVRLEQASPVISEEKANRAWTRATMSEAIERRILERREEKRAECDLKLAAMFEAVDKRILEKTEIQKECELKLSAVSERVDKLVQETAERNARMDRDLVALERITVRLEQASPVISEEKPQMEGRVAALQNRTRELEAAAQAMSAEKAACEQKLASMSGAIDKLLLEKVEEKAKFEQRLAAMSETIEKRVLERMEIQKAEYELRFAGIAEIIALLVHERKEEQVTAPSTDPINTAPTAPGSCDPSGLQSNSSEQLKGPQPHQDGALTEEEERLPPPGQSANPQPPAAEEEMVAHRGQNLSETSDELSFRLEPCAELEKSFQLLNSDEWWVKIQGLDLLYQLAKHQPETLFPDVEGICRVVVREVLNPMDSVSKMALGTLTALLSLLKSYFDPFLDWVADALYLKAASVIETLQQLASVALDHMIKNCSPLICMKVLLLQLSDPSMEDPEQEVVARECFAEHLLALVESAPYEPEMHELFLSVGQLTQDPTEVVRSCAEKMLAVLSKHLEDDEGLIDSTVAPALAATNVTTVGERDSIALPSETAQTCTEDDWIRQGARPKLIVRSTPKPAKPRDGSRRHKRRVRQSSHAPPVWNLQLDDRFSVIDEEESSPPRSLAVALLPPSVSGEATTPADPSRNPTCNITVPWPSSWTIPQESLEFQDKSAVTPDTIDFQLLTTTEEQVTAPSTDPIDTAPTAPGSCDPSGLQSNSSEQLKGPQPHQDGALTEEEERLPPPGQSANPEPPAAEEEMVAHRGQNLSETSDELSFRLEPCAELEKSFQLLNSDEWWVKIQGLDLLYQLAKHQPETLFPDVEGICRVVVREVLNPMDSVSKMALGTLTALLSLLKSYFDPFLDWVADALYLKAASVIETLQQLASVALDHMIKNCSPLICMKVLLLQLSNPRMEDPDQEAFARQCFAEHLLALVESVPYETEIPEFCLSVSKLTQDFSEVVRSCAEKMLAVLSKHLEDDEGLIDSTVAPALAATNVTTVGERDSIALPSETAQTCTEDDWIRQGARPKLIVRSTPKPAKPRDGSRRHKRRVRQSSHAPPVWNLQLDDRFSVIDEEESSPPRSLAVALLPPSVSGEATTPVDPSRNPTCNITVPWPSSWTIPQESLEFQDKSAATLDTIDFQLLTTTEVQVTAPSTDPIDTAPTAPGSRDPSGLQSNSSEQLKGPQPHQDGALTEEEERLPPPGQSANPEPPAAEEEMVAHRGQNLSETSDELSFGLEPCAELEKSFQLLNSDEWWMKIQGLDLLYQLAKHQPETLFPDMEDICRVVVREVLNPLDSVSKMALGTLTALLSLLKSYFDPFLDWVADALYLKAASVIETLQQLASVALDHMIKNCSPLICMKVILLQLSDPSMEDPEQEVVARECFAVHLLALVESAPYEPEMHELFLSVGQLTQDTSEVVRSCAEKMLAVLSKHVEVHPLPVVAASSKTTASPSGPTPSEQKKKLEDILHAILPPRVWSDGDKEWMQPVSSQPATRTDVIKLQRQLDLKLQQTQAGEGGICPVRRELYSQCFDELIRQTTISCAERGLLLLRVRDESLMCMATYQALYESSVLQSELNKAEMERKIQAQEKYIKDLEQRVKVTQAECEALKTRAMERGEEKDVTGMREEEVLRCSTQQLMEQVTAPSPDPIDTAPTAPGSRDPSGLQSNSSEQLKSQQADHDGALTEEGAHEEPRSSCVTFDESLRSQWWDVHSRSLEIPDRGLDREQEVQTAALDCSSVSQLQEEERLPPTGQSANPEPPAAEEEMETHRGPNLSETSDELSLGPEPHAELEKTLELLRSQEGSKRMKGLGLLCQLAKHQPETLFLDIEDICYPVLRMVLNPLDSLSKMALETLATLLSLLKTYFDPFLDWVAKALFLKAAFNNETVQQLANVALDEMIRSCSPLICMEVLLYNLSNPRFEDPEQEAVARECFAKHLLALVESAPYEPEMHGLFISVSKLTQDPTEVVRGCAEKMLAVLSKHVEVQVTAPSPDPIDTAPTAPGSRDPSGLQSNSSEQLKGPQPHQDGALTEEEERLPPPGQSANPEPPAAEEEMVAHRGQNLSETSDELSLGPEPHAELEETLELLNSNGRWMKIQGLDLLYELAMDQPETLFPDMEGICRVVVREVLNPMDSVSAMALGTLAALLSSLKTYFDPFLDWVAEALFQKAASDNEALQQLANVALDHMIQSCNPLICMKVLLYILSDPSMEDPEQEAVARECFAVHLLALVESAPYEPEMHELFLSVGKLTQDTSEVVRGCAEKMLAVLSKHMEVSQLLDQEKEYRESLGRQKDPPRR